MDTRTEFRSHSSTLLGVDTVIREAHIITGADGTVYLDLTGSGDPLKITVLCAELDDLVRLGHAILNIADGAIRADKEAS